MTRSMKEPMTRPIVRRLALVLAPALLASGALAQPAGPPPGAHDRHGPPSAEMQARHQAMEKQRLEDLKIVLRIRPDQEAALAALVAAHRPRLERKELPAPDGKPQTTPQRLDEMAKMESEMAARHTQAREALAKFYAALSPEQQKVFDALQRLHGPGPMMMAHGGPGRRMNIHHGPGGPGGGPMMMRHELDD